jgi:hypothetical protein
MRPIEIYCPNFGALTVVGDRLHEGSDFFVHANGRQEVLDCLVFLDSRGVSAGFEHSLANRLISYISRAGGHYLLLCRPLELTTWATLVNFMKLNELNPSKIVTNMGFVDFTPKKSAVLKDATQQVEFFVGRGVAKSYALQECVASNGEEVALHSMVYGDAYRRRIEEIVTRQPTVIINTPLVDSTIHIKRARPKAFFSALSDSNAFNHSIGGAHVVDLPSFDETLTYDAVHYTTRGNEMIFEKVKGFL